jgi:ferric-dicitrate binding protein FerR (iron transport regulator)
VTAPRYAELAGKLFAREARSSVPPPEPGARTRAIAAIADAIGARARRRQMIRWSTGLSVAAAVALAALGVARHASHHETIAARPSTGGPQAIQIVAHGVTGATSVLFSGAQAPLADESPVPQGSRLVTPANGRATLAFSTGTNVVVGEGSDMSLGGDGAHQVLHLSAGSIDLHVAKLTAQQRFVVGTSDAEVEVRGTRFHVSVVRPDPACGHGTPTRVAVTEGVVVVRHDGTEDRITAGQVWPSGCPASEAAGDALRPGVSLRATNAVSTLPERNALFERAVDAKNAGDVRGSVAGFEGFLARYPSGPLAEDSRIQIMRLLAKVSPSQAASAARQYLAEYPKGAARDEAEGIISAAP